jgi:hypothetical protein
MIGRDDIKGVKLDGIPSLGSSLRHFRLNNPDAQLVMWKSDVSSAYRLAPVHPLWQIKQIITVDGSRYVDRCNNFGGRSAQKIWHSVICLVVWIAVVKRLIDALKCFVDDHFSFELVDHLSFYAPYNKRMPTKQANLLMLWDELGIPHEERKQVSGLVLPCIGFDVDPNRMTATLSDERKEKLMAECERFTKPGKRRTLREFWQLQGYVNWALNVFPKLRPALCATYAKTAGKTKGHAPIRVNTDIVREME